MKPINWRREAKQLAGILVAPVAFFTFHLAFRDRTTRIPALRRLAYFSRSGLCYNKVKKNANTSVVLLLQQIEDSAPLSRNDAKWQSAGLADLNWRDLGRLRRFHYFVVIRDPYSRVLSAFLDKFRHEGFRRRYGAFDLTPEGFGQFLRWLETGGILKDPHWDLQTKLIVWPLEKFDTVIRLENFAEEIGRLLNQRNIPHDPAVLADIFPQDASKKTSASQKLESFYNLERKAIVQRLFRADFEALGYPV